MEPIKQFNQTIEISCYSKSTIKSYKYHIKQFLIYYNDDLRQENIEKHLYHLKTKKKLSQIRSPLDNIKIDLTPNKNVKDNNRIREKVVKTNGKI